ncbi:hypothetical protein AOQ71_36255 [Bradyrhizobium manausense]|uniref:Uncharacterized protein n=1 Tax=Bradyrhizobium manausense TaxID=989370 RepID=A0A0R3CX33_9BRAD|nr:hypothetical protein AOQ71_36255 [Bradyrhizobium manausense]
MACDKAKVHGYPHELWTTRLLARHAREHRPAAGHACLANLVQGTVCKILGQEEIKSHKVRYYLENRDAEFEQKMAEILCVYREVEVLKKASAKGRRGGKPRAGRPSAGRGAGRCDVQYVWRFLRGHKIDLAARKSWCESNDPDFTAKAGNVVGLYVAGSKTIPRPD